MARRLELSSIGPQVLTSLTRMAPAASARRTVEQVRVTACVHERRRILRRSASAGGRLAAQTMISELNRTQKYIASTTPNPP
jgi:hypothetical protein